MILALHYPFNTIGYRNAISILIFSIGRQNVDIRIRILLDLVMVLQNNTNSCGIHSANIAISKAC